MSAAESETTESETTESETTEKPAGPRSRKGVLTRARLVDAAKQIFEEDGFLDARISDISERAGLSHGSFYTYFESKEEIFREVALEVEARLSAPLGDVILRARFASHAPRADPGGDAPPPRELPPGGPDHGCDRAGLALRRAAPCSRGWPFTSKTRNR